MNISRAALTLIASAIFMSGTAQADGEKLADKLSEGIVTLSVEVKGCDTDAKKYCPDLPPNSQKLFLCIMAYEEKLSKTCKVGIAEASLAMKKGVVAIDYSASACESDVDKYCMYMEPGHGNIVRCLKIQESKLSKACMSALKETGLWNVSDK